VASDTSRLLKKFTGEIRSGRVSEFFNRIGDSLPFQGISTNGRNAPRSGRYRLSFASPNSSDLQRSVETRHCCSVALLKALHRFCNTPLERSNALPHRVAILARKDPHGGAVALRPPVAINPAPHTGPPQRSAVEGSLQRLEFACVSMRRPGAAHDPSAAHGARCVFASISSTIPKSYRHLQNQPSNPVEAIGSKPKSLPLSL
jgi:hypothetical protein